MTWGDSTTFDGFRVPADSLIGEEGKGFAIAMEETVNYLHQRVQVGAPLAVNQALRFKRGRLHHRLRGRAVLA